MSFIRKSTASITTATSGAATVYTTDVLNGLVWAIQYEPGASGLASTADLTITGETTTVPIMTKANATKIVDSWFYPRQVSNAVADGAAASGVHCPAVMNERIKTVVAQGGNAKTGSITFYVV